MLRIAQELTTLATSLPLSPASSVFVRTGSDNVQLLQALITGPPETPYHPGCFLFDVHFPREYPAVPPQVERVGCVRLNSDG